MSAFCACGFPLTGARPSRGSRLGSGGNNTPSERAAASYRKVNIINKNRPLPSHSAGQRPVLQVRGEHMEDCIRLSMGRGDRDEMVEN